MKLGQLREALTAAGWTCGEPPGLSHVHEWWDRAAPLTRTLLLPVDATTELGRYRLGRATARARELGVLRD